MRFAAPLRGSVSQRHAPEWLRLARDITGSTASLNTFPPGPPAGVRERPPASGAPAREASEGRAAPPLPRGIVSAAFSLNARSAGSLQSGAGGHGPGRASVCPPVGGRSELL